MPSYLTPVMETKGDASGKNQGFEFRAFLIEKPKRRGQHSNCVPLEYKGLL